MLKTFEQKVPQRSDTAAAAIMNYFAKTWGLGGHLALAKRTPGIELLSQKVSAKMSAAAKNYLLNVLLSLFNCLFIVWFPPFYPISCLLNVLLSLFNCLLKRKNEKRRDFAKLLSGVCTQPTFDDDDDIENCDEYGALEQNLLLLHKCRIGLSIVMIFGDETRLWQTTVWRQHMSSTVS